MRTRHFLVADGEIRPLPRATIEKLRRGEARLPAYAGRELHILELTLELKNRAPVKVREIVPSTVALDEDGRIKSRLAEDLRASLRLARGHKPRADWSPSRAEADRASALALGREKAKLRPPKAVTA